MYLGILENERKKKTEHSSRDHQYADIKLEKRFSEPVKPEVFKQKDFSINPTSPPLIHKEAPKEFPLKLKRHTVTPPKV